MSKTVLYSLAFIALGLISGSIGPTLPALAAQTNVEMKQISNLFVARSFGTMIGSWMIGRLYDRFTGHPLLAVSLLVSAVAMALLPVSNLLWMVLALSACIGLASGAINVGGNALIVIVHGERVRPFMSVLHFAFGLGGFLAPIFVAQFEHHANRLQATYWTLALLSLPAILWTMLSRSPATHVSPPKENAAVAPPPLLGLLILYFFLEVGAEASVMGWLFSYAVSRGVASQTAYQINSAFWAAFTLGRLATIWLSVRFPALSVTRFYLSLAALFAVVLLIFPFSSALLWTCAIGLGLSVAPVFPSTFGYVQTRLHLSGRVTGLFLVGSSAGGMFWPRLIGQFFETLSAQIMTSVILFNLLGALAILSLVSRSAVPQQEIQPAT